MDGTDEFVAEGMRRQVAAQEASASTLQRIEKLAASIRAMLLLLVILAIVGGLVVLIAANR